MDYTKLKHSFICLNFPIVTPLHLHIQHSNIIGTIDIGQIKRHRKYWGRGTRRHKDINEMVNCNTIYLFNNTTAKQLNTH